MNILLHIIYVPLPPVQYKLKLPKRGCVGDLKEELGRLGGVKATHLAVVDVYNSRFHRIYSDRDPLSHIMDRVGHTVCSASKSVMWVWLTVAMATGLSPYSLFAILVNFFVLCGSGC